MGEKKTEKKILAAHGRWIKELQESFKVIKLEIDQLKERISVFEKETSIMTKNKNELKSEINSLRLKIRSLKADMEKSQKNRGGGRDKR